MSQEDNAMTRKIILAVSASLLAFTATACNTVRGASEDVESVANEVDEEL
jgi:entericidin B